MGAEGRSLTHLGEEFLSMTGIAAALPRCRQRDGKGGFKGNTDGSPAYVTPRRVIITCVGQPIRWLADGSTPDGAPGMGQIMLAGEKLTLIDPLQDYQGFIGRFQAIRHESAMPGGYLEVSFFD